jgi:hypothetical protein
MEAGELTQAFGLAFKKAATGVLSRDELVEIGEGAVDDALVGHRPEHLGRLQFGRVGGQADGVDALGPHQRLGAVPACALEQERDALGGPRTQPPGELSARAAENSRALTLARTGSQARPLCGWSKP